VAILTAQREEKQAVIQSAAREVRTVEILETRRDRSQVVEKDHREQRVTDEFAQETE
jgi:flagellar biosynthesis chaperone FliJ